MPAPIACVAPVVRLSAHDRVTNRRILVREWYRGPTDAEVDDVLAMCKRLGLVRVRVVRENIPMAL